MGQTIAVTVKGFSVTESLDPKSKTEVPTKLKPKAVSALKNVQVDPPKGKTLAPYFADITVAIKKVPKGVRAEVKVIFSNQDPYSKREKSSARLPGERQYRHPTPTRAMPRQPLRQPCRKRLKPPSAESGTTRKSPEGHQAVGLFRRKMETVRSCAPRCSDRGYPLKAGQLTYDCRYSTMHGMPVTGGPRLWRTETIVV